MKHPNVIILLSIIFLSACSKEPMIRLSEERQAYITEKQNIEQASHKNKGEEKTVNIEITNEVAYDETMSFDDIVDFIPIQPNQINQYIENDQEFFRYMEFVDGNLKMMQVREQKPTSISNHYYAWDEQQISDLGVGEGTNIPSNQLSNLSTERSNIILKAPIQKGNSWEMSSEEIASITNLYETVNINGSTYQDVVEVAYQDGQQIKYFAKGLGIVAEINPDDSLVLSSISQNSYFQVQIPIKAPQQVDNKLVLVDDVAPIKFQTNEESANIYTKLFQTLGWITPDISVNKINKETYYINVDFTPGIVAAMNQNEVTERGVIPAIVMTMIEHYGVEAVQLTVNGLGMTPNTISYPDGGLWYPNDMWKTDINQSFS